MKIQFHEWKCSEKVKMYALSMYQCINLLLLNDNWKLLKMVLTVPDSDFKKNEMGLAWGDFFTISMGSAALAGGKIPPLPLADPYSVFGKFRPYEGLFNSFVWYLMAPKLMGILFCL